MAEVLHILDARYLHDFVLWLRFSDGAEGEVDLAQELEGEVFQPLGAREFFVQVQITLNCAHRLAERRRFRARVSALPAPSRGLSTSTAE